MLVTLVWLCVNAGVLELPRLVGALDVVEQLVSALTALSLFYKLLDAHLGAADVTAIATVKWNVLFRHYLFQWQFTFLGVDQRRT